MQTVTIGNRRRFDWPALWLGAAVAGWMLLFVWQGLDFTDVGFWLTGYQQFYTHPDTVWPLCWLASFVGHWVGVVFGGGVVSYKIGNVVLGTLTALLAYRVLAGQFGRSHGLAALVLVATCFITRAEGGHVVLGYYGLTALFYLAGTALLLRGLVAGQLPLVVLAGAVLGANTFARLPNVLGLALVAGVWLHAWNRAWPLRQVVLWSAAFAGGFLLGLLLLFGLIAFHGHAAAFAHSLASLCNSNTGATYGKRSGLLLFKRFLLDQVWAFALAASVLAITGAIACWAGRRRGLLTVGATVAGAIPVLYLNYFCDRWGWIVTGICYLALWVIVLFEWRKRPALALLAFLAGLVLVCAPLGSNCGMQTAVCGMWLALPLVLAWLWQGVSFWLQFEVHGEGWARRARLPIVVRELRIFAAILILALLVHALVAGWRRTFRDSPRRTAMTHAIAHPLLAGTYTTAARARVVSELLEAMPRYTPPGADLLACDGLPLLYFLTRTHPWLGVSWPDLDGIGVIAGLLRRQEQAGAPLPCMVRATGNTYTGTWPADAQELSTFWQQDEARRVFAEFGRRHGYAVAWSNAFFEILIPAPPGKAAAP